jgi:hypothetical protein
MANETSAVQLHIPQQLIDDTIRAEIVRQIPDKSKFAEAVIQAALREKPRDSYGGYGRDNGPTIFQKAITDMINVEAQKVFAEWIEQNRAAIREALIKEMTRSQAARVKQIAEKIADGMMKWNASVTLVGAERE